MIGGDQQHGVGGTGLLRGRGRIEGQLQGTDAEAGTDVGADTDAAADDGTTIAEAAIADRSRRGPMIRAASVKTLRVAVS